MFPIQEESSIVATLINMKFNSIARCVLVFLFFLSFLFFSIPSTKLGEEMFTKKKEKLYAKLHQIIFVCSYYIIRFVNCFLKKRMHPVRIFLHFSLFLQSNKIFDPIQVIYSSISIIFPCPAIVQRLSRKRERRKEEKEEKVTTRSSCNLGDRSFHSIRFEVQSGSTVR